MEAGRLVSTWTLAGAKEIAATYDRLRPTSSGLVALLYHRVGGLSATRVDLPKWLFEEQMARISESHEVVGLDDALGRLEAPVHPGARPVVAVTFDDGTADFVDEALPILVRYRIPAIVYIATEFIENGRCFPRSGRPASWSGLADALGTGLVTVGSHTHTHALLDRVDVQDAVDELERSIYLIGERLGIRAGHFAYPKALLASPAVEREVRLRFRSAALAGTRPNSFGRTDPYRLARSPIQVDDGLRFFEKKLAGGMRIEDDIRRLVNRRRMAAYRT